MPRVLILAFVLLALLPACSRDRENPEAASSTAQAIELGEPVELKTAWLEERQVHEPQFLLDDGGALLLAWREHSEAGSDLYMARRGEDGQFGTAIRVNDEPATVASYPHDEMRVALAAGPNGLIGVGWSDSRGQVRAAVSSDGAATFTPSVRLEQTDLAAYRGFPAIAFDASGVLHAVWIDSRYAEGMAEEPADLYYATIVDGVVTESNLTAKQEATVCGCCRTYIEVTEEGVTRALFRNGADGYRDIFTVSSPPAGGAGMEAGMSAPKLIGQPLWKLNGCPMSGPIAVGDRVLWSDGSSGRKLLMVAPFGSEPASPLFSPSFSEEQQDGWMPRLSPRAVSTNQPGSPLLLLPGQASSRLVSAAAGGKEWRIEADDLPPWATSAFYENGSLLLIGSVNGEFQLAQRRVDL